MNIRRTLDKPLTFDDDPTYRSFAAMNWSRLKLMRDASARTLQYELLNGPTFKGNAATRFGSLAHTVALEPDEVTTRYRLAVETNKRTKAYRLEVAEAEADGVELVTRDDMVKSQRMALAYHGAIDNLSRYRYTSGLESVEREYAMASEVFAGEFRVVMKGKLDELLRHDEGMVLVDYKTTGSPLATRSLQTIIGQRGYHIQAALYRRLYRHLNREAEDVNIDVAWVFVSTNEPHECVAVVASDEMMMSANEELDHLLQTYAQCLALDAEGAPDAWPGIDPVLEIDLLPWHEPKAQGAPNPLPF